MSCRIFCMSYVLLKENSKYFHQNNLKSFKKSCHILIITDDRHFQEKIFSLINPGEGKVFGI